MTTQEIEAGAKIRSKISGVVYTVVRTMFVQPATDHDKAILVVQVLNNSVWFLADRFDLVPPPKIYRFRTTISNALYADDTTSGMTVLCAYGHLPLEQQRAALVAAMKALGYVEEVK